MTANQHLKLVGGLYLLYGGFFASFGLVFLGLGVVVGVLERGGAANSVDLVQALVFGVYSVVPLVFGLPYVVAGIGLLRRWRWSWILALVVGAFAVMNIPCGTVLGVYALVKLVDSDVRALLGWVPTDETADADGVTEDATGPPPAG